MLVYCVWPKKSDKEADIENADESDNDDVDVDIEASNESDDNSHTADKTSEEPA